MKIIITSSTVAPGVSGPQHLPANSLADIDAPAAHGIVAAGRGLYVDSRDDPTTRGTQAGRWTAPEALVSEARAAVSAAGRKSIPKQPEPGTSA